MKDFTLTKNSLLRSALFALAAASSLGACDSMGAARASSPAQQAAQTSAPVQSTPSVTPVVAPTVVDGAPPSAVVASVDQINYSDKLELAGMRLGGYYVTFGRSTLIEAQQEIGAGVRSEHGDGGSYEAWLCYTIPHSQRVWLIANGAQGSDFITDVRASADPEAQASDECPQLPARFTAMALDPSIWLGANFSQLERRYGAATARLDNDWVMFGNDVAHNRDNLRFTDSFALAVRVEQNTVVALTASKTMVN